jgi:hypothetical protein
MHGILSYHVSHQSNVNTLQLVFTRCLPSVAPTRWLYTERLVEVVSHLKIELLNFFESVMSDKKEWGGETHISAQGYHDILKDFDLNLYLKVFSGVLSQPKNFSKLCK